MTKKESTKLVEIEQELRVIQRKLDCDEIGNIADRIYALAKPIRVISHP